MTEPIEAQHPVTSEEAHAPQTEPQPMTEAIDIRSAEERELDELWTSLSLQDKLAVLGEALRS